MKQLTIKKMKNLITILSAIILAFVTQSALAQEYTHELGNSAELGVEFTLSQSDIAIEGYDGTEVVIQNTDYEPPPERAEGLRPLYGAGQDNTGIGLSVEEENGVLKVVQARSDGGEFIVRVPNQIRVMIEEVNWGGGDISISNHNGEIEIKSNSGDIELNNITGPVIASSTSGDVDIVFSRVSTSTPTSISLVSGYIDVTMPPTAAADLHLSSVSGEIYTNLDIALDGEGKENMMRLGGGRKIEGTLNGGGVEIQLKSVSGDIYLRRAE
jgi:hypothetical protein